VNIDFDMVVSNLPKVAALISIMVGTITLGERVLRVMRHAQRPKTEPATDDQLPADIPLPAVEPLRYALPTETYFSRWP
jgi:hypothetical protein